MLAGRLSGIALTWTGGRELSLGVTFMRLVDEELVSVLMGTPDFQRMFGALRVLEGFSARQELLVMQQSERYRKTYRRGRRILPCRNARGCIDPRLRKFRLF